MIDDRPVWVTIPTIGQSPLLLPLLRDLEADQKVDRVFLTVNLEEFVVPVQEFFGRAYPFIEVIETWQHGKSLHHGWNTSIRDARDSDAWLAVLNDDIVLREESAVGDVAHLLSRSPRYAVIGLNWKESPDNTPHNAPAIKKVKGTYRNQGVGGFAWVCDPHKVVEVPSSFEWWYGDDHIMLSAERDGHLVGLASHVHVEHQESLTTRSSGLDWMKDSIAGDIETFRRTWPGK